MAEPAWTHPVTGEEFAELTDRERTMLDVIESLDRAVDRLEDVGVRREQTLREYEESESVRLARWLDGGELRYPRFGVNALDCWTCRLFDIKSDPMLVAVGEGASRDQAITDAVNQAEAATPEGGEDRG